MISEQLLIGGTTAMLCVHGLWRQQWLLTETRKGRLLVSWFGPQSASWVLRTCLTLGIGFGVLLAAGIINPVRWSSASTPPAKPATP
jgi:hypothetical protein